MSLLSICGTFVTDAVPWSGDVNFVSAQDAYSMKLTYVNNVGNAIIKVDNTSNVPDQDKRNSVRSF